MSVVLSKSLTVNGMVANQTWRKGDVAIYQRGSGLELIFVQRVGKSSFPDGRHLPQRETYPTSTKWGKCGWSFDAWREPYLVRFAESLAGMKKGRGELVGRCMRDNRVWVKHLGPLRRPAQLTDSGTPLALISPRIESLARPDAGDGQAERFAIIERGEEAA